MKRLLFFLIVVVLAIVGWKQWQKKQAALPPPAIHFSDEQLQALVAQNGAVNLAGLAALVPAQQKLAGLTARDVRHIEEQLTERLAGATVTGEFHIDRTLSKGKDYACVGSHRQLPRLEVQWYVLKSQASDSLAGSDNYAVSAPVDRVELLPSGVLHVQLERPAGR